MLKDDQQLLEYCLWPLQLYSTAGAGYLWAFNFLKHIAKDLLRRSSEASTNQALAHFEHSITCDNLYTCI